MSALSTRTRIAVVAASATVFAPFALMGGSASAVETPVGGIDVVDGVTDGLLDGALDGVLAGVLGGTGNGTVDGATGTATGLAGAVLADPLGTVTGAAANPTGLASNDTTDALLGDVLDLGVVNTVTDVVDLTVVEGLLETVTEIVDVEEILETVTEIVDTVTETINLRDLLELPIKVNAPAVKGVSNPQAQEIRPAAQAGALPHTGGNADMTALLLCAGLAVAGTGVTLVTRRRGAIMGA